jgi:integrase
VAQFLLDGINPTIGLKMRTRHGHRERTLNDDEIRRLWRRLDEPSPLSAAIRDALRLELLLGVRVGEVVGAAKKRDRCRAQGVDDSRHQDEKQAHASTAALGFCSRDHRC